MYVRYIYKLCELHLPAENYTEAAFTLKLHSDLLSFPTQLCQLITATINNQNGSAGKLCITGSLIISIKAKCWEEGIPLCKELAELYEKKLLDYAKLSIVLKTQAKFFDNILNQIRPEPEYFRVGFYGLGFPLFLRNKVFVYRGLEYERIGAFTQRLQTEFPQAQILMKSTTQMITDSKGQVDKDNEFKSLWIERTTLTIASQLPGILRWFEYTAEPRRSISPLSMRLQGVIEAAVNGGIAKYQEAFFTLEFSLQNPEETHKIIKLKSLILEKVQILEGGLSLHGRLAPPEVIPLHRRCGSLLSNEALHSGSRLSELGIPPQYQQTRRAASYSCI
ncbi:dedicator of cytokinesis protein 3 [Caerostris extrusa]|uniref:Dedicator of cytokinesis protein 3 n=1 Tax=Caerostris extrusa TaxID=172846 RepID=A0AAV4RCM3_CAEEX|nr:dedicator of cytokinesis protein 3 [Caerostris extrusa]